MSRLVPPRWVSFECYGTLIDWESGVRRAFVELAHVAEEETQELFAVWEHIQFEKIQGEYSSYEDTLYASFREAVEKFGYWCPGYAGDAFIDSLPRWAPFPDVNSALQRLAQRYKLAIISNIDRSLLGGSIRQFPVRFDALITAEDARAYKPNPAVFRCALERMGCKPQEVAHVAFGAGYDLKPAHDAGMRVIYLNRGSGSAPQDVPLEAEIRSLSDLPTLWA
jgi:2-haloacid dehalogenase